MYYGAFLNLVGKSALVVGGGIVGQRKTKKLLECGAHVTIVSPVLTHDLTQLVSTEHVHYRQRAYSSADLDGMQLVFATTNQREVNRLIASDARARAIWCNVADDKDDCDFIVPASTRVGHIQLAISTQGHFPGVAKSLRLALDADLQDGGTRFYKQLKDLSLAESEE